MPSTKNMETEIGGVVDGDWTPIQSIFKQQIGLIELCAVGVKNDFYFEVAIPRLWDLDLNLAQNFNPNDKGSPLLSFVRLYGSTRLRIVSSSGIGTIWVRIQQDGLFEGRNMFRVTPVLYGKGQFEDHLMPYTGNRALKGN